MKPLSLDALPKHSAWARYLLDPTGDPPGDPEAYTNVDEYDRMYAHLLEAYRANPATSEQFARRISAKGRDDPGPLSMQEELYLARPEELRERENGVVRDALTAIECVPETVVDLGCGWGSTLGVIAETVPDATVIGGEYSPKGVELAQALYTDTERVSVREFDFHGTWDLLDAAEGEPFIFTKGALTTLPEVDDIVDRFGTLADDGDVAGGVHLEQVSIHPETTLGLLRRRYERVRGYNGELVAALEGHDAIDVQSVSYDVLGPNPLHPLTMIRWRPR